MFARATFAFVSALHVLAAANVLPRDNQCTSGTVYCCNSLVVVSDLSLLLSLNSDGHLSKPTDPRISTILGLLGVDPASLTDFVGGMSLP